MGRRLATASGDADGRERLRSAPSVDLNAHGTPAVLREYIAECISLAADQAGLVQSYAEIGDDKGLEYALRRFAAYAKSAFSTFQDLKAIQPKAR